MIGGFRACVLARRAVPLDLSAAATTGGYSAFQSRDEHDEAGEEHQQAGETVGAEAGERIVAVVRIEREHLPGEMQRGRRQCQQSQRIEPQQPEGGGPEREGLGPDIREIIGQASVIFCLSCTVPPATLRPRAVSSSLSCAGSVGR